MYFTGQDGCIQIRRATSDFMETVLTVEDLNLTLNRFGFEGSEHNLITGDRVDLETDDPRGIAWLPVGTFYAHVNAEGAVRAFPTYEAALSNDRSQELTVSTFTGGPIEFIARVRDTTFEPLGGVTRYSFDTDREAFDVTALGDGFAEKLGQGTISGSGTIDCFFDYRRQLNCPAQPVGELGVLLLQLLLRLDMGSAFTAYLQLAPETDRGLPVFYEVQGVVTRAGVEVDRYQVIACSVDFVSTGEIRLVIGEPSGYILTEAGDRIQNEHDLGFMLSEPED